jgi:hypothetical protein
MDKNYVITLPVEDISEDQDFKFKLSIEIETGK